MIEATAQRTEGPVAKAIERETSKVPSDVFLWGALGFLAVSAIQTLNRRNSGVFLAQLAPTLLMMGVYNKLVKLGGSDQFDEQATGAYQGRAGA
jgi:hypothetical protein